MLRLTWQWLCCSRVSSQEGTVWPVDPNAEIATEQNAVARFFEDLQKQAEQEREEDAVATAVVELLTVAVVPIMGANGEKCECKMCGERNDNHTDVCPLPPLERWITRVR